MSFIDDDPSSLSLQYFCISYEDPPASSRQRVKVFSLPLSALRYVKPGSIWRNGTRSSANVRVGQTRYIRPTKARLIICRKSYSTEEVIKKIARAKDPHLSFVKLTNHLFYRGSNFTVRIPCSEVIRHYLCPTKRYALAIMTGNFDNYTRPEKNAQDGFKGGMHPSEAQTTEFLRSTPQGLRAARYPYKMLKISYIKRISARTNAALLLSSIFPTPLEVVIKMSARAGSSTDTVAVQLHRSSGSPMR